ncbi:MAG: ABC transporter substrate-binding protein [Acidobacteriota bacterium]|nr:ABC transporter substrate-binding protein [Acidobacteriota bacterium]
MIRASVLLLFCALLGWSADPPLTPSEERGKQIYLTGKGIGKPEIQAAFGVDATTVPGSVMPCVNCHGHDGRGRPEGGLVPSNITWTHLTKPYGASHEGGRKFPPYDLSALKRAVTMGLDSAGNKLNPAMPRYIMTHADLADLTAYLQKLGEPVVTGVTDDTVVLGVVLPPEGRPAGLAEVIRTAVDAGVDRTNQQGGLFNRKLTVRYAHAPSDRTRLAACYRDLIAKERPFALIASYMVGAEESVATLLKELGVPMIGAFALFPQTGFPVNPYVFYVETGRVDQVRALVRFAAERTEKSNKIAVLHSDDDGRRLLAETISRECRLAGFSHVESILITPRDLPAHAGVLSAAGIGTVFFLGRAGRALTFLREGERLGWHPTFLGLQDLADPAFQSLAGADNIFLAAPAMGRRLTAEGMQTMQHFREHYRVPSARFTDAQLTALVSLDLLKEGIIRTGRALTREQLVTELENLYNWTTGLTRKLRFGPNRRVGTRGAYIVRPDPVTKTWALEGSWIEL